MEKSWNISLKSTQITSYSSSVIEKVVSVVISYQFDDKMNKDEQLIVKSVIQRFNKDMKSCLEIK